MGHSPRFVVVGTGRCGTTYVSEVLTRTGLACGHEDFFCPEGPRRRLGLVGDVSWLAVPFLDSIDVPTYHVYREPLAVVNSFLDLGFFTYDPRDPGGCDGHRPWRLFANQHFSFSGDPVRDAMRWYVDWNTRCERYALWRFPIEDPEPGLVAIVSRELPGAVGRVREAMDTLPADVNALTDVKDLAGKTPAVSARDLPDGPEAEGLVAISRRYGYTTL